MFINVQKIFDRISFLGSSVVVSLFVVFSVACSDGTAAQDSALTTDVNAGRDGHAEFIIEEAKWDARKNRLEVKGQGLDGENVVVSNADTGESVGMDEVDHGKWRVRDEDPATIPCRVSAVQSDGQSAEIAVKDAPNCDDGGGVTPPPSTGGDVSINSTSQNGPLSGISVPELSLAGQAGYTVFAINDLGMHCGDFDTRISSILPPFNVLHAQVIQKGSEPTILGEDDGISVIYSASSNPFDPSLFSFESITMISNTSGLIYSNDGPATSIVRPGTASEHGAYTKRYINVNHVADPVSIATNFKAPGDWELTGGLTDLSFTHLLKDDSIQSVNDVATLIHSAAHYVAHPNLHLRLLTMYVNPYRPTADDRRAVGSFSNKHGPAKIKADLKQSYENIKNGDTKGLDKIVDAIKSIKDMING